MTISIKDMKPVINHISIKYKIPKSILKIEVENIINNINTNAEYNPVKCHAYKMLNGEITQCTRSKKENCGLFCLTHYKHDIKNELKYGKIDVNKMKVLTKTDTKSNVSKVTNESNESNESNDSKSSKVLSDNKNKKTINVEYITLNNIDYLFNPITKYVYDFETKHKIGKLDNDQKIIKENKTKSKKS